MNWIQRIWYAREIKGERQYQERQQLDEQYKKEYNQKMQKWEDDAWDRDIEFRAQTMIREYNNEKWMWKVKHPGTTIEYNPIIIAPLPRKLVYTVYEPEVTRYSNTKLIDDKVYKRFNELLKEQKHGDNKEGTITDNQDNKYAV